MSDLKVTSVRYFETRRGTGYEVKTNVDGIEIWNDGTGGPIFLEGSARDLLPYKHLTEDDLHKLIDEFESWTNTTAWKDAYRMMSKKEGKSSDDAEREICNIQDMSKDDAVAYLVNELAGRIL
jgi:hypothetical protein